MKNNFRVEDQIIYIELNRKDGSKLYTLVDLGDLEKLMGLDVRWCGYWDKDIKSFYAMAHITINGKKTTLKLHRFLMDLDFGNKLQVDHILHNTLDNRKSELRIVTNQENHFNLKQAKGYHWNKRAKKFHAGIRINGKTKYLGLFNTELEARAVYLKAKKHLHKLKKWRDA